MTLDAIIAGGTSGTPTRDIHFKNCQFKSWGGKTFDTASKIDNFGWRFTHCGFQGLDNAQLGNMVSMDDPYFLLNSGTTNPALNLGRRATITRCILDTSQSDAVGLNLGTPGYINFKNAEGAGSSSTSVAMQVHEDVIGSVTVTGGLQGWNIGVQAPTDGAVHGLATMTQIGSNWYQFDGGDFAHGGTVLTGDFHPVNDVSFASQLQGARVIGINEEVSNASPGDLPPGVIVRDTNRGGTGNVALLFGNTKNGNGERYINFDGFV